jgi:hypothetical protein
MAGEFMVEAESVMVARRRILRKNAPIRLCVVAAVPLELDSVVLVPAFQGELLLAVMSAAKLLASEGLPVVVLATADLLASEGLPVGVSAAKLLRTFLPTRLFGEPHMAAATARERSLTVGSRMVTVTTTTASAECREITAALAAATTLEPGRAAATAAMLNLGLAATASMATATTLAAAVTPTGLRCCRSRNRQSGGTGGEE